jgi:hypothetical protein
MCIRSLLISEEQSRGTKRKRRAMKIKITIVMRTRNRQINGRYQLFNIFFLLLLFSIKKVSCAHEKHLK